MCEKCNTEYKTEKACLECEAKEISKVEYKCGDRILVLTGEGKGDVAMITEISIASKDWGHYFADRYHHTPLYVVDFGDGSSRCLCFDELMEYKND